MLLIMNVIVLMKGMTIKKIYRGLLVKVSNGEEDDLLGLNNNNSEDIEPLAEILKKDLIDYGRYLSVNYYLSDKQLSADECLLNLMEKLYGEGDIEYNVIYSEITGYLWTDEEINIGGHNLLDELKNNLGKWLHMEIEFNKIAL